MAFRQFLQSRLFRKHFIAAVLLTFVLLWLTMVILSFYTHRGESYSVPDFSGMTLSEAQRASKKMKFRFELQDSIFKAGRRAGTILTQNPGPGHKIKSGRVIYLTLVSSIPGQQEVPKLTDVSLRQAKVLLESLGFVLGKVEFIRSEFNDLVLEQKNNGASLPPGSRIDQGSMIDLVVGQNAGGNETFVPDFTGLTLAEARIILDLKFLQPGSLSFDTSVTSHEDSVSARVISQSPQADSTMVVPAGTPVSLILSIQP